jgi:hypothetical protein
MTGACVRMIAGLGVIASAVACGSSGSGSGSPSGSASVTGAVGGRSLVAHDAVALVGTTTVQGQSLQQVEVVVTTMSDTCGWLQHPTSVGYANSAALVLGVLAPAANTAVTATAYTVAPGGPTGAIFTSSNADCDASASMLALAQSGTINLTTVGGQSTTGNFDLTFPNGDHLSGSFTAPVCDAPLDAIGSGPPITSCQ